MAAIAASSGQRSANVVQLCELDKVKLAKREQVVKVWADIWLFSPPREIFFGPPYSIS